MGHNPIPPARPPTGEEFHLGRARAAFVDGLLDVAGFERLTEHVLRGGYLSETLAPRSPLLDRVRVERRRRACEHRRTRELVFGWGADAGRAFFCDDCGAKLEEH